MPITSLTCGDKRCSKIQKEWCMIEGKRYMLCVLQVIICELYVLMLWKHDIKCCLFICCSHCCWGVHTTRQVMEMRVTVYIVIAVLYSESVVGLTSACHEYRVVWLLVYWRNSDLHLVLRKFKFALYEIGDIYTRLTLCVCVCITFWQS